jgi:hypothetical protein
MKPWIPACAGMTAGTGAALRRSRNGESLNETGRLAAPYQVSVDRTGTDRIDGRYRPG